MLLCFLLSMMPQSLEAEDCKCSADSLRQQVTSLKKISKKISKRQGSTWPAEGRVGDATFYPGEPYGLSSAKLFAAARPNVKIGTCLIVTNIDTRSSGQGRSVRLTIRDHGTLQLRDKTGKLITRMLDLSLGAKKAIGPDMGDLGVIKVKAMPCGSDS